MAIKGRANINLTSITDAIVQGTEPLNPTDGMLWLDNSTTPNILKRYDGVKWVTQTVSITDADPDAKKQIDKAKQTAQNALTSANGKNKNYYGIMEPVDPQEGDRWFKSVNGEEVQTFIYSSGSWEPITLAP
ncbi:carbohydrate-binding protein CenC, partial [Listeria monocytogenes]|nr:carbohydrate-binding protein CenC [Listeria monocytogenes]EAH4212742.1 carbohydrate-binding protein CenC [Listeria monocytogenes]EAH4224914.1 carbohydrate-binding protein CenC [Listeria monocytogenes]EAK9704268.1 carbohydrate-binding protein CenC [Listeria monocytogenes]EAK9752552.1 carbohydrate-binding protein CenC [Listeria monocytogenes]